EGEGIGVRRWSERNERGKHSVVPGIAEWRNKGRRFGVGTSGVVEVHEKGLGDSGCMEFEQGSYTIFLDNLAALILKGEIYKEFCRFGTITDVYVSRKQRRKCKGPFAFIRFKEYEGAKRAMEWKNGAYWKGKRIHVTLSKYRRSSDWRPT
ncbi:hypothetical protein PIB30_110617, partial [Stylosanthes scabra]|nr:hypothetical protein [Stylosanthes scabra]